MYIYIIYIYRKLHQIPKLNSTQHNRRRQSNSPHYYQLNSTQRNKNPLRCSIINPLGMNERRKYGHPINQTQLLKLMM